MRLAKDVIDGKVRLTESEIRELTSTFTNLYNSKPNVVKTPADDTIYVGDLHGDLQSAKAIRNRFMKTPDHSVVFLGDYADRGPQQIETFNLVMSLAIQYPERALMLRGNHESDMVARMYGFFDVVKSQYMPELFEAYCEVFGSLPLASISQKGVFSCHGGVPEGVDSLGQIQSLDRYSMEFENPIAFQMAWNDPVDGDFYFGHNRRGGATRSFGRLAFEEFARNLKIKLMVRAHEAFPEGYRRFFGGRLVSVFSTRYGHRVDPKVVHVGEDLVTDPLPL